MSCIYLFSVQISKSRFPVIVSLCVTISHGIWIQCNHWSKIVWTIFQHIILLQLHKFGFFCVLVSMVKIQSHATILYGVFYIIQKNLKVIYMVLYQSLLIVNIYMNQSNFSWSNCSYKFLTGQCDHAPQLFSKALKVMENGNTLPNILSYFTVTVIPSDHYQKSESVQCPNQHYSSQLVRIGNTTDSCASQTNFPHFLYYTDYNRHPSTLS